MVKMVKYALPDPIVNNPDKIVTLGYYSSNGGGYQIGQTTREEFDRRDDLFAHPMSRVVRDNAKIRDAFDKIRVMFSDNEHRDCVYKMLDDLENIFLPFATEW